jgi:hypothetical protein
VSPSVVLIWRRNRTWQSARQYAHIQLKFQANFSYALVVLADVVDVDKPEWLLRLGSKRQWHTSRRISFGATQYKYDDATCKYYTSRISAISRCASDGAIGSACAVKWKRRRFPQHIKQQHDDALIIGINKQRQ